MLDERLTLAAALYKYCEWGADIGSDHAYLPCQLLKQNICQRMIVADVSPKALSRARDNIARCGLSDRTVLVCADGLDAVDRPCQCVSIMGMGGETMAHILHRGHDRLQGAALVLSAHTELPLVRAAIRDIGYHITQERICRAAGRFYIFWRAEHGPADISDEELRFGRLLWEEPRSILLDYCNWRIRVTGGMLNGLRCAARPDEYAIRSLEDDIAFYQAKIRDMEA